jgi:hypothetical protein
MSGQTDPFNQDTINDIIGYLGRREMAASPNELISRQTAYYLMRLELDNFLREERAIADKQGAEYRRWLERKKAPFG